MPIHDQGYRRYAGGKIRRSGVAGDHDDAASARCFSDKRFIVLLAASWIQFVVRAVQFYLAANFSQAALIAPNAATFRDFFDKQDIFVYIVTVTLGARLIAQDRRVNALQIYLSKPLTRVEYILGKFGDSGRRSCCSSPGCRPCCCWACRLSLRATSRSWSRTPTCCLPSRCTRRSRSR